MAPSRLTRRPRARGALPVAVTASVLMIAACGGQPADSAGQVSTLTVLDYYTDEPGNTQTEEMFTACGDAAGVAIDRQSVPGPQLMPRVLQQAASRNLPDILMLNNPDVKEVAQTGALLPMAELGISTEGYAEGVLSAVTHDGKQYGLGAASNTLALFYNTDLFAHAGLAPPQTWDELKAAAAQLTEGSRYGVAFAAPADYEASWQFMPFLWSNGGSESRLDSPQAAEALQLWVDLVNSGSASRSVVNWRQADVKDQFVAGNAAMMINGPWQIPALEEAGVSWGVVPVPVPTAGAAPVTPLGGEVWTVPLSDSTARQQKAAEVLSCVLSEQHVMEVAEQRNLVPARLDLAAKYASQVPEMAPFVEQVGRARALTGELGVRYPRAAEAIYTAVQTALTGGATAEEALVQAQRTIETS